MEATAQESSIFAKTIFYIGIIILLIFPLAGLGSRFGWWHYHSALMLVRWDFYAATLFLIVSLIGILMSLRTQYSGDRRTIIWAFIFCLVPVTIIGYQAYLLRTLPWIHDITTDTKNPPRFIKLATVRPARSNLLTYGGEAVAKKQKLAYPGVKPIITQSTPADSYTIALRLAKRNNWQIITANKKQGTIEAVATTLLFGFKDDVAIRIKPNNSGSRVDIRSVSRVGRSDFGTNAKRIEKFIRAFNDIENQDKARKNA